MLTVIAVGYVLGVLGKQAPRSDPRSRTAVLSEPPAQADNALTRLCAAQAEAVRAQARARDAGVSRETLKASVRDNGNIPNLVKVIAYRQIDLLYENPGVTGAQASGMIFKGCVQGK
jgi:hypothetical protein